MVATLELFDGTTTLNLYKGADYDATMPFGLGTPPADVALAALSLRGYRYRPRSVTFGLRVLGASVADLGTNVRNLEAMLVRAKERQRLGQGTIVILKTQLASSDVNDIEYRVLSGDLDVGPIIDEPGLGQFTAWSGSLTLLLEPLGRLTSVSLSAATLENEEDGANLNYADFISLSGNEAGRLQLKLHDPGTTAWSGSKKIWVAKRSGSRRTDTLFVQAPDATIEGTVPFTVSTVGTFSSFAGLATNASGGASQALRWTFNDALSAMLTTRVDCGHFRYDIAGGSLPEGLFRVLARVSWEATMAVTPASANLKVALGWSFGANSYTPVVADDVAFPAAFSEDSWKVLDLGELIIPKTVVPDGFTAPTLQIRIYAIWGGQTNVELLVNDYLEWAIDHIFLLPIDEGMWSVDSIATADRLLADSKSDKPGIYVLNGSDVVQNFAAKVGSPFDIGPEDTRIYWLRDDPGDPTLIQVVMTPTYLPQVRSF